MSTSHALMPRVTIATNDGPGSRAALRWAADLLRVSPADATLVTVESVSTVGTALHLESAEAVLRAMAEDSVVDAETRTGDPADELIASAAASDSDLIVIGGLPGTGVGIHGSVHGRVAALSPVAVATIPSDWDRRRGPITVGLNYDLASDAALDYAVRLARRTGLPLRLTHVRAGGRAKGVPTGEQVREQLEERARELRTADPDLDITVEVLDGDPVDRLADAGEGSSILVLGRRDRTALGRLIGSVSARVLGELPCPVITVPRSERGLKIVGDVPGEEL